MAAQYQTLVFVVLAFVIFSFSANQIRWEPLDVESRSVIELAVFAVREYNLNLQNSGQSTLFHHIVVGAWRQAGSSTAYIRLRAWNKNEPEVYDAIIEGAFPSMLSFHALEVKPDSWQNIDPTTKQVEFMAKYAMNHFNKRLPRGLRMWNHRVIEAQKKEAEEGEKFLLKISPSQEQKWRLYEAIVLVVKDTFTVENFLPLIPISGTYLNEDPRDQSLQDLGKYAVQNFNFQNGEDMVLDRVISAKLRVPSSFVHYEIRMNVMKNGTTRVFQAYFRENGCSLQSFLPMSDNHLWSFI